MKYLAAYMLLVLGGKTSPSTDDVKSLLSSAGIEADDEQSKLVVSKLEGKSLSEIIAAGSQKLSQFGGGGSIGGGSSGGAAASGDGAEKAEDAAAEEEEEEEEEVDLGGGVNLFDDDDDY